MKTILLSGSEGAIGHFILRSLYQLYNNIEVIRVSRQSYIECNFGNVCFGDLRHERFVSSLFSEHKIDYIIHAAAIWNGYNSDISAMHDNVLMTLNITKYLPNTLIKFIYLSTAGVYEQSSKMDESLIDLRTTSSYSMSKLFGEELVKLSARRHGHSYTIWRPFHVVSPLEMYKQCSSHVCTNICHKIIDLNEKENLMDNDKKEIGFTWVEDAAKFIAETVMNSKSDNEIFNLGTPIVHTINDLICEIYFVAKKHGLLAHSSNINQRQTIGNKVNIFSKMKRILNIEVGTSFSDCVEKFITIKYKEKLN